MSEPKIEDPFVMPSAPLDGRRKNPGIPSFGAGLVSKEEAEAAKQESEALDKKRADELEVAKKAASSAEESVTPAAAPAAEIVEVEGKATTDATPKPKGGSK